jgi:hypothetical protein
MSIKVEVWFVDGGYMDWVQPATLVARYHDLVGRGLEGKALVHQLLTDDWGPPPTRIRLTGRDAAQNAVDISIPYI